MRLRFADISAPGCRCRRHRRLAMTVVELTIGMAITAMVLGALSALWFAVARTWAASAPAQAAGITGNTAASRLEAHLRAAKYVCQYSPGSADGRVVPAGRVFFWKNDDWTADGVVQFAELVLIEHDAAAKELYVYEARSTTSMSVDQRARASLTPNWAELSSAATVDAFKGFDFIKRKVLSESIVGAAFNVPTIKAGTRPSVEFTLTVSRTGGDSMVYGLASMRSSTTRPN